MSVYGFKFFLNSPDGRLAHYHHWPDAINEVSWDIPKNGNSGDWKTSHIKPKPHFGGLHAVQEDMSILYLLPRCFSIELEDEIVQTEEIIVARRGRLIKELFLEFTDYKDLAIAYSEKIKHVLSALRIDEVPELKHFTTEVPEYIETSKSFLKIGKINSLRELKQHLKHGRHLSIQQHIRKSDSMRSLEFNYHSKAAMGVFQIIGALNKIVENYILPENNANSHPKCDSVNIFLHNFFWRFIV